MMKTVWQDDEYGCGAACLAMLAGISYRKARRRLFDGRKPGYIQTGNVLAALSELGFHPGASGRLSKANPVSNLKRNALVKGSIIEGAKRYGHFLVWDADERVLRDPYRYRQPVRLTSYTLLSRSR